MSIDLLKHCLDSEFYSKNKAEISEEFFSSDLRKLYQCVKEYYIEANDNLTPKDLYNIYTSRFPSTTSTDKQNTLTLIENMERLETSSATAALVLKNEKLKVLTAKLASETLDMGDGKHRDFDKLEALLVQMRKDYEQDGDIHAPLTDDIHELLDMGTISAKWKFCLPNFTERANGVGPGVFAVIGARPNVGKSAFIISLAFHPDGWAKQGAKILILGNEEFAARTKLRGVSCYTGIDISTLPNMKIQKKMFDAGDISEELYLQAKNKYEDLTEQLETKYAEIADKIIIPPSATGIGFAKIEELIEKHKPDIVIIDQLDKVKTSGKYGAKHEELGDIYVKAREIAKEYMCTVVGVCQASAEAEGKKFFSYDMLAGSKTDKAAEADLIITIGKEGYAGAKGEDSGFRVANFCKNKLTGKEGHESFMLDTNLSRIKL